MTCPACGTTLSAGQERCPACDAAVALPVEGALAPDPLAHTPPARRRPDTRREIPGLRKKDTWKDEVRERVKHRRLERGASEDELPLFRETGPPPGEPEAETGPEAPEGVVDPYAVTERLGAADEEQPADLAAELLLRPEGPEGGEPARVEPEARSEWPIRLPPPAREQRALERPARPLERLKAGALDLALLLGLWAVVVYFAGRALHVPLAALAPAWAPLAGYLAFLGIAYAVYFTGTTGQTPGKMAGGLRVVNVAGRPPGYPRAFLRALLAVAGIACVLAGLLPMYFDPARRALHDRMVGTRVVKG